MESRKKEKTNPIQFRNSTYSITKKIGLAIQIFPTTAAHLLVSTQAQQ